jgi:hypothetical protein
MARASARNVRPSLSSEPSDKLAAALAALGYARLRDSTEYRRAALYYDACSQWFDSLPEDNQETCRTLVDVVASAHKGAAENIAASLPPAPRCPLRDDRPGAERFPEKGRLELSAIGGFIF